MLQEKTLSTHSSQPTRHENSQSPFESSLMQLFTSNECPCQSQVCKEELNCTFRDLVKQNATEMNVRDLICIVKGSQKSKNFSKIFCTLFSYLAHGENMTKPKLEAYLELFTVLTLKSDDIVKEVLMQDLIGLVESLKQFEVKLFAEQQFSMKIPLYRIYQLRHCLKSSTDCKKKSSQKGHYSFDERQ